MVSVGVDAHKKVLVAVALDDTGQVLSRFHGGNAPADWQRLTHWLTDFDAPVVGIEGAYSYGRGLGQWLCTLGFVVFDINPRWTAAYRRTARRQHKSDAFDAQAVALVVQRDGHDLPRVHPDDLSSVLHVLVTERESALTESVRLRNQLHAQLFQLRIEVKSLDTTKSLERLRDSLPVPLNELDRARLLAVTRLIQRCLVAIDQLRLYTAEIEALAEEHYAPLTRIHGVGKLTAGVIASLLGPASRFTSEAQLAAFAGVAPLEVSSAGKVRHRLNRSGSRKLNSAIYIIALCQARSRDGAGRAYLDRRRAQGHTWRDAVRALKRFIARAIYKAWRECFRLPPVHVQAPA